MFTYTLEAVLLKLRFPGQAKQEWPDHTAELFRRGVQLGLDYALSARIASTGEKFILPPVVKSALYAYTPTTAAWR